MRIVIFVALLAFIGGMHIGMWLERDYGTGRSAERQSGVESPTESGTHSKAPPIVRFRPASLPVQMPVMITAYSSEVRQTDAAPDIAAWGDNVWALHRRGLVTLAVSRDLEDFLPPGTTLIVADRMHERWRRRVDVWFPSRDEATRWGMRRGMLEMAR